MSKKVKPNNTITNDETFVDDILPLVFSYVPIIDLTQIRICSKLFHKIITHRTIIEEIIQDHILFDILTPLFKFRKIVVRKDSNVLTLVESYLQKSKQNIHLEVLHFKQNVGYKINTVFSILGCFQENLLPNLREIKVNLRDLCVFDRNMFLFNMTKVLPRYPKKLMMDIEGLEYHPDLKLQIFNKIWNTDLKSLMMTSWGKGFGNNGYFNFLSKIKLDSLIVDNAGWSIKENIIFFKNIFKNESLEMLCFDLNREINETLFLSFNMKSIRLEKVKMLVTCCTQPDWVQTKASVAGFFVLLTQLNSLTNLEIGNSFHFSDVFLYNLKNFIIKCEGRAGGGLKEVTLQLSPKKNNVNGGNNETEIFGKEVIQKISYYKEEIRQKTNCNLKLTLKGCLDIEATNFLFGRNDNVNIHLVKKEEFRRDEGKIENLLNLTRSSLSPLEVKYKKIIVDIFKELEKGEEVKRILLSKKIKSKCKRFEVGVFNILMYHIFKVNGEKEELGKEFSVFTAPVDGMRIKFYDEKNPMYGRASKTYFVKQ